MTKINKKELEALTFTKLKLTDAKIIFANLEDVGFGLSLTIDATDEATQKSISEWVSVNKIGKTTPGVANFKEYTDAEGKTTKQYSLKFNDFTKFAGINGLTEKDLGFGAVVDLIVNPFIYDNKFGLGVSSSISAVVVKKGKSAGADNDLADLLADATKEEVPFN
jgi:hypothetical protein